MTKRDPVLCPQCFTAVWKTVERGRYEEDLYMYTQLEDGASMNWFDHDEYEATRDVWACECGHIGSPEIQNELEDRAINA